MAKTVVKLKLPTLRALNKKTIANRAFQKKLGKRLLGDILHMISIGKSPVAGQGRYVSYKVDRAGADARKAARSATSKGARSRSRKFSRDVGKNNQLYPNSVKDKFPGKRKKPVNLKLSGAMLKEMKFGRITGGVKVGLLSASTKIKDIFTAHNTGSNTAKKVPRRAILPTGDGERFTASIRRRIKNLYLARVRQLIKKHK